MFDLSKQHLQAVNHTAVGAAGGALWGGVRTRSLREAVAAAQAKAGSGTAAS